MPRHADRQRDQQTPPQVRSDRRTAELLEHIDHVLEEDTDEVDTTKRMWP